MKKTLCIILSVISLLTLSCGCRSNDLSAKVNDLETRVTALEKGDASSKTKQDPSVTSKTSKKEAILLIKQEQIDDSSSKYITANFTVQNNTDIDINTLTININILDQEGNIISTTHPQEGSVVSPGQNITIEALVEVGAYALQLDGYSYFEGSELEEYKTGRFNKDIEKLILN